MIASDPAPLALPRLPWWVRGLDLVSLAAAALAVSSLAFGGFRLHVGDDRITSQDAWRPLLVLAIAAGIRHWRHPRPSLPERLLSGARRAWHGPATPVVLPALIASRLMVLGVGFLGVVLIGFPPNAPPFRISRNEAINLPMRWDAGWYLSIVITGYDWDPNARPTTQQNIAFFPGYPMAVRGLTAWLGGRPLRAGEPISGNRVEWAYALHRRALFSGLVVSIVAFGWGLVYLFRLARSTLDDDAAAGAVVIACAWPTALFYSAFYTEGLFFLTVVGAWYHLRERQLLAAAAWGLLCGLTRPNGFLLAAPLALLALGAWRPLWRGDAGTRRAAALGVTAALAPVAGMLIYSGWLYWAAGTPFAWMEAHQAWGRVTTDIAGLFSQRVDVIAEQGFYGYTMGQPTEAIDAIFTFAALLLAIPIVFRLGPAYGLFVLVMIVPPLTRGGFLSLGRLTSTLFPLFLYLGWLCRGQTRHAVVLAFAGLQALLAVLFFTWRPFY